MLRSIIFVAIALAAVQAPADEKPLRVYFVGNSVTDTINYRALAELAKSRGHNHVWGRHMIPGAPLQWIWEHPKDGFQEPPFGHYPTALANFQWDVLSLQPFDRHLDGKDGDLAMAKNLIDLALPKSPDLQVIVYARWPRQQKDDFDVAWLKKYTGGWDGTNETRDYFERLTVELRKAYPELKIRMVPVGHVMYELNQRMKAGQVPGYKHIKEVFADDIHLNNVGSYVVGCTYFATLYKENPKGLPGVPYKVIDPKLAEVIQQTVWKVVSTNELVGVTIVAGTSDDPGGRYLRMSSQKGISPFEKAAYEQLAKLHESVIAPGDQQESFSGLKEANDPMAALYKMGFDVIPVLVDALDDDTPTKAITYSSHGNRDNKIVWKVRQLATQLILRFSHRDFVVIEGGKTTYIADRWSPHDLAPQFKKVVLDWYAKNRKRTAVERTIADMDSDVFQNRLAAIGCIGSLRLKAEQKAVLNRIKAILSSETVDSTMDTELASCSAALGSLGDKNTIDSVRRICKHFSETNMPTHSDFCRQVFQAYWGLAMLGNKEEAIRELKRLYDSRTPTMDPFQRKECEERLETAKSWYRSPLDKVSDLDQLLEQANYKEYFIAALPPKMRADIEKHEGYERWQKENLVTKVKFYRSAFSAMKKSGAAIYNVGNSYEAVFAFRKPVGKYVAASMIMIDEEWYIGELLDKASDEKLRSMLQGHK